MLYFSRLSSNFRLLLLILGKTLATGPDLLIKRDKRIARETIIDFMRGLIKSRGIGIKSGYTDRGIPRPCIFCANNDGMYNWMLIFSFLDNDTALIAEPFLLKFPFSLVTKSAGFLALDQKRSFLQSKNMIDISKKILSGESVFIFLNTDPGNTSTTAKFGPAILSVMTGAPIIPIAIKMTEHTGAKSFKISMCGQISPKTASLERSAIEDLTKNIAEEIKNELKKTEIIWPQS